MIFEGDIQRAIKSTLEDGLTNNGFPDVKVKQNFQPTKQGAPSTPFVFFTQIAVHRYGYQGRKLVYNVGNDEFDKTESQWIEATYQINAEIDQDITDSNSANSFDVVSLCAMILGSDEGRALFRAANIGIERITDIRTPKFLDGNDQNKQEPSFDFILTYNQSINSVVLVADPITGDIQRV